MKRLLRWPSLFQSRRRPGARDQLQRHDHLVRAADRSQAHHLPGQLDYDEHTHTVSNLQGAAERIDDRRSPAEMVWLPLNPPAASWYDNTLGGMQPCSRTTA